MLQREKQEKRRLASGVPVLVFKRRRTGHESYWIVTHRRVFDWPVELYERGRRSIPPGSLSGQRRVQRRQGRQAGNHPRRGDVGEILETALGFRRIGGDNSRR